MKSALNITKAALILDFNEKWSLRTMQKFCDHFDPTSFKLLEDPLNDPLDLFALAKTHPHPIALEQGLRSHGVQKFLSLPTLKACEFKPTIDMSLLTKRELYTKLAGLNIDIAFSSAYETSIGIASIGYLAQEIAPHSHHGLDTLSMFNSDLLLEPFHITPTHLIIKNMSQAQQFLLTPTAKTIRS
jgi:O-succinylbenzoate synthase